jgi:drug/metabolite transporter (DMT)-like permease
VFVWSLLGATGFYLLGQVFLFAAIIHSEPSRVSPLLGLKIFMLSMIGVVFLHQTFGPAKWLAVVFSTVSVFLLSHSGKRLERRFIVLGMLACLAYCMSDIYIKAMMDHFRFMGIMRGGTLSAALSYTLSGLVGAAIVLMQPRHSTRQTWLYAIPFAASWFIAMILLFSCFGLLGVVFGNIIQSVRGIISIGLGFVVAHVGFEALEPKASKRMILARIIAAVLMTAAVALFLM